MARPICPLCGRRRARRTCPAMGQAICSVCCGTKRRTRIACPPDCVYLQSAEAHPPAAVQRQRRRDGAFLISLLHGLTGPQQQLAAGVLRQLAGGQPDLPGLGDADVEQAARALAETYETASRGIVYEHAAAAPAAQRLAAALKRRIDADRERDVRLSDLEAADVLRRIETGARDARQALDDDAPAAWLAMLARIWPDGDGGRDPADPAPAQDPASRIILPGRSA